MGFRVTLGVGFFGVPGLDSSGVWLLFWEGLDKNLVVFGFQKRWFVEVEARF